MLVQQISFALCSCLMMSNQNIIQKGDLAIYYELGDGEDIRKRGIVEVDHSTGRWGHRI